jgi:hypothetical protein
MEYGMEFEVLFGVSDGIQDITRSSGMVRRIRFIYRKSFYKFENDPVILWKVLEGSRKVRKESLRKEESRRDSTSPWPANPRGGGVPGGLPLWGRPPPHMEGGNPTPSGIPTLGRFPYIWEVSLLGSYSKTWIPTLGDFHLYNEEEREGAAYFLAAPPRAALGRRPSLPLSPQTLAVSLLHHIPHA